MSIFPKVDNSSIVFLNTIDRLTASRECDLPKIVSEISDKDIAGALSVINDSVSFKVLQLLSHSRLCNVLSMVSDEILLNIISWRNTKILVRMLTSFSIDENPQMPARLFSLIDQPTLIRVFFNTEIGCLATVLAATASMNTPLISLVKERVNLFVSCLIPCNKLVEVFNLLSTEHLGKILPMLGNIELIKIIPLISRDTLVRAIPNLSDESLGYMLSKIDSIQLVRRLTSSD